MVLKFLRWCAFLVLAIASAIASEVPVVTRGVDWQPLSAQVARLLEALDYLGAPLPADERAALLAQLAKASEGVDAETTTRLWLKATSASAEGGGLKPDAALQARVREVLSQPALARAQMDVLTNEARVSRSAKIGDKRMNCERGDLRKESSLGIKKHGVAIKHQLIVCSRAIAVCDCHSLAFCSVRKHLIPP